MEYFKIYNESYKLAQNAIRRALIQKFKKFKAKNRPFNTINNNFVRWAKVFGEERFEKKFMELEPKAFTSFRDRWKSYDGERQQVIQWVLEDEVKMAYLGHGYYKSYNNFISELAKYDAFSEVVRHYHSYYSYYELIYQFDKYEYFYLKDFEGHGYETSEEYNEMLDVKYPYRIEERKRQDKELKAMRKEQIKNPEGVSDFVESFSDDERMVIANIFYNEILKEQTRARVPLTVFLKLVKIVGLYTDLSLFGQKAQSNTMYRRASGGLEYYRKQTTKLDLINSILRKLEHHEFEFITDSLKVELAKIKNSQIN